MNSISIILDILNNLFYESLLSVQGNIIERIKLNKFKKKVDLTARKIINNNDGSILTSNTFELFLKNYHPIEKMFLTISGDGDYEFKEQFITKQIELFFNSCNSKIEKPLDRYAFKELFEKLYDLIENFYKKNLTKNERYLVSVNKRIENTLSTKIENETLKIIDTVKNSKDDIIEMISNLGKIDDCDLEWAIYQSFSAAILNGRATEVHSLFPLLKGNNDLELGVEYLFNNFSNKFVKDITFDILQDKIRNDQIYTDLAEKTIYKALLENDEKLLDSISERNFDIYEIKCHLQAKNFDMFYTVQRERKEEIYLVEYKLTNNYPKFKWLVNKICMFSVLKEQGLNAVDCIESLLSENDFIIEQVLLLERKYQELDYKIELVSKKVKDLLNEIELLKNKINDIPNNIQKRFYCTYLRIGLLVSDEKAKSIVTEIPNHLKTEGELEMLCMQAELEKNMCVQKIIELCIKNNQYWLFNNYLIMVMDKEPNKAKELIESYRFSIDKDPSIFLIYVQLVHKIDGVEKSLEFFENYKQKYNDYTEFWLVKLRFHYSEEELINISKRWLARELSYLSHNSDLEFLKLLMEKERYKDALHGILLIEKRGNLSKDFLRIKARALLNTKHEIEALGVYKKLFNDDVIDSEILYYIMILSINNKRHVEARVLECAKKIENATILELTAICEESNGNHEMAEKLIIKAMLRNNNDDNLSVYGNYLSFHTKKKHLESDKKVKCVSEDTVTYCVDEQKNEKIICIYSERVLPHEPFFWEGAEHIYKETAIQRNLLRKKINDTITIKGICYKVKEIEHLDAFLFRISMSHLVDNGSAKLISTKMNETGEIDINSLEEQMKEVLGNGSSYLDWINHYKNIDETPLSFFLYSNSVSCTYTQLIQIIAVDTTIPFREKYGSVKKSEKYVVSTAALVVLNEIEFNPEKINKEIIISTSLGKVVSDEVEKIIDENDRERVASMGMEMNHIYVLETPDEAKQENMTKAVGLKNYSLNYNAKENVVDLSWQEEQLDIKDYMGIADYDAFCLAQKESYTVITAEVSYNMLANMLDIGVDTICIADFLNDVCIDINQLLDYVEILMNHRFVIPFTDSIVIRLAEVYDSYDELDREKLLEKWMHILNIPLQDENYKKIMARVCRDFLDQTQDKVQNGNPIWSALLHSEVKYLDCSIRIKISDGKLITQLVHDSKEVEDY